MRSGSGHSNCPSGQYRGTVSTAEPKTVSTVSTIEPKAVPQRVFGHGLVIVPRTMPWCSRGKRTLGVVLYVRVT